MKKSSREKLNLFFSSFLVIGFIVCTYFFMTLTTRVAEETANLIKVAVFVLFGLVVFYATRVGEGVPVKRFSPIVLIVMDLPALFIIIASLAPAFPLHEALASVKEVMMIACIALGYAIPYTFLSGFELKEDEVEATECVDGGLEQEIAEAEENAEEEYPQDETAQEDVQELEVLDGVEESQENE